MSSSTENVKVLCRLAAARSHDDRTVGLRLVTGPVVANYGPISYFYVAMMTDGVDANESSQWNHFRVKITRRC